MKVTLTDRAVDSIAEYLQWTPDDIIEVGIDFGRVDEPMSFTVRKSPATEMVDITIVKTELAR